MIEDVVLRDKRLILICSVKMHDFYMGLLKVHIEMGLDIMVSVLGFSRPNVTTLSRGCHLLLYRVRPQDGPQEMERN